MSAVDSNAIEDDMRQQTLNETLEYCHAIFHLNLRTVIRLIGPPMQREDMSCMMLCDRALACMTIIYRDWENALAELMGLTLNVTAHNNHHV